MICNGCDIFQASNNPKIAQQIANWFKKKRNIKIKIEDVRCSGCKGDRTKHWSPDCWILECCVDKKGLNFCYECKNFSCKKLNEWAEGSKKYGEALGSLKGMRKK